MKVISRMGRLKELGKIENGCLFKYPTGGYYIATDDYDTDRRSCVNVESGVIIPIQKNTIVETLDYASIELTGTGVTL